MRDRQGEDGRLLTRRQALQGAAGLGLAAAGGMLKGADKVANDPEGSARFMVDRGYSDNFDYTCDILKEIPYKNVWRDFDAVDSIRFYALRLQQAGLIKSTPEQILERGTEFRFLTELRKELRSA